MKKNLIKKILQFLDEIEFKLMDISGRAIVNFGPAFTVKRGVVNIRK